MTGVRTKFHGGRKGTTIVEVAVVLPVFLLFIWALVEFGHAFMVVNMLNAAAKRAAREGIADDVTTAEVVARVREIVGTAIDTQQLTVHVKDASVFDQANPNVSQINYSTLPAIELDDAEPRQLFVVYVEVPYTAVAIMPPKWVTGVTLKGQSVQRHE
jgi:Flp pilus assembly protein TadG